MVANFSGHRVYLPVAYMNTATALLMVTITMTISGYSSHRS